MSENLKAYPLANSDLSGKLLDLIQLAVSHKQLRKGANEATKALNRGRAELIILAADADPPEILLHLPILCEDKNVPYIYIENRMALGRACGVSRSVIACSITMKEGSSIATQLNEIRIQVEATLV